MADRPLAHRPAWQRPLNGVIETLVTDYDLPKPSISATLPVIDGFVLDRRMSVRAALEGLCGAFGLSMVASGDKLVFQPLTRRSSVTLDESSLADEEDQPRLSRQSDSWEAEVSSVTFAFKELFQDFRQSVVRYDQPAARTKQDSAISLAAISTQSVMSKTARDWLRGRNYARHSVRFSLPPSQLPLEAGDLVALRDGDTAQIYRIDEIEDGVTRRVSATLSPPRNAPPLNQNARLAKSVSPSLVRPLFESLDLPLLPTSAARPHAPYLAVYSKPWIAGLGLYQGEAQSGYRYVQSLTIPAIMGVLESDLAPWSGYLWDRASLSIRLFDGDLASVGPRARVGRGQCCGDQSRQW